MACRLFAEKRAMVVTRSRNESLKLLYDWVKQESISLQEFKELVRLVKEVD